MINLESRSTLNLLNDHLRIYKRINLGFMQIRSTWDPYENMSTRDLCIRK